MLKQTIFLILFITFVFSHKPENDCNVENCSRCPTSPDTCELCRPEYFLQENKCLDCCANCRTCSGPEYENCIYCNNKYAFNSEHLCVKVGIDNCYKADDSAEKCAECLPEFYLKEDQCLDCAINCKTCSDGTIKGCQVCNQKYALDEDNFCVLVNVENCLKADESRKKCGECQEKFFLEKNKCSHCTNNCRKCFNGSETGCKMCDPKFAVTPLNRCVPTNVENCWKTDFSTTKCAVCYEGFHLVEQKCIANAGSYLKLGFLLVLLLLL